MRFEQQEKVPSKTYLGCRLVRQVDGTVKVWAPVRGGGAPKWELILDAPSMRQAHNYVHNTRIKRG